MKCKHKGEKHTHTHGTKAWVSNPSRYLSVVMVLAGATEYVHCVKIIPHKKKDEITYGFVYCAMKITISLKTKRAKEREREA